MNIANIQFNDKPLFLAPMHEVTDIPFRSICKKTGADGVITEFVSVEALIRNVEKANNKMVIKDDERPAGIQIYGKNVESFQKAVAVVERFKPDFIDINAGCSAGKHASRGECAGLLRDLPLFEQIIKTTVNSTRIPVTVKTRLGWDTNSIIILEAAKMIEQAGARALTVHCRTRTQSYKHPADWSWLERIKKEISIPLIGNGDIMNGADAKRMLETGCDGVMIGRGAIQNPWIFKEIKCYLRDAFFEPPSFEERVELCLEHLKSYVQYYNVLDGLYAFRKFYTGYFKGIDGAARLRKELMTLTSFNQKAAYLERMLTLESIN